MALSSFPVLRCRPFSVLRSSRAAVRRRNGLSLPHHPPQLLWALLAAAQAVTVWRTAAVHFCCPEAMQHAGEHAGDGAAVTVCAQGPVLRFEVADDGVGFTVAEHGHGFVNRCGRLGAIGGRLTVESRPGAGTRVSGEIPPAGRAADMRPPGTGPGGRRYGVRHRRGR